MKYNIKSNGIEFTSLKELSFDQQNILEELQENGFIDHSDDHFVIDESTYFELSTDDLKTLEIYKPFSLKIVISPISQLGRSDFDVRLDIKSSYPFGKSFHYDLKNSFVIEVDSELFFLNFDQYQLLKAINAFKLESNQNIYEGFRLVALIQRLKENNEDLIILTDYLANQIIKFPNQLKIEPNLYKDYLILNPLIDNVNPILFNQQISNVSNLSQKDIVNFVNENRQTERVIFDDKMKKALKVIDDHRLSNEEEKKDILINHPEQIFFDDEIDDDLFDLSYYSDRVVELGIYKPKFYPFISPYKSEWVPGFEVKSPKEGTKRIIFKTEDELNVFEKIIQTAKEKGEKTIRYNDDIIEVEQAENFVKIAKKQLKNPKDPVKVGINGKKVLIIHENAEDLEYNAHFDIQELKRTFTPINNLKSPFELKDYQIEGVSWLQSLVKYNLSGGLLADDMGLGKTLQILYFIEWHSQFINTEDKPYIIVAPVSLLENWENELYKFFDPTLELSPLYGSKSVGRKFDKNIVDKLQRKQIILTNYETLRNSQLNLCAVDYACVILDEAQKIKTPGTLVTNVAKAIRADFKIAMTGTPVENSLVDLWCIIDFVVPGLLGNAKEFAKKYQNRLKDPDTDVQALGIELRDEIKFYLTRRLKKDVVDYLPSKTEYFPELEMPKVQADRYVIELNLANPEHPQKKSMLEVIHGIKLISDHPFLIDKSIDSYSIDELIHSSAKLKQTIAILEEIKLKEEKVIVFSDRKETQRLLKRVIRDRFYIEPSIVNGDTPSVASKAKKIELSRQQTIDKFESVYGFNVIIMSPISAGYGLNVVGANHVIHYTRHWNPAKENQATDRVYRITQDKPVHIYHPIAVLPNEMELKVKSFDQVLNDLLKYKNSLATDTLFPTEQMEVTRDEMYGDLFEDTIVNVEEYQLESKDINHLTPLMFEVLIAVLFEKQGYEVHLTPISGDKGVDVVVLGNENFIIQVKQSTHKIKHECVQEIVTAKAYFDKVYGVDFKMKVFANNNYGNTTISLAEPHNVELNNFDSIVHLLNKYPVLNSEIVKKNIHRMDRV